MTYDVKITIDKKELEKIIVKELELEGYTGITFQWEVKEELIWDEDGRTNYKETKLTGVIVSAKPRKQPNSRDAVRQIEPTYPRGD